MNYVITYNHLQAISSAIIKWDRFREKGHHNISSTRNYLTQCIRLIKNSEPYNSMTDIPMRKKQCEDDDISDF